MINTLQRLYCSVFGTIAKIGDGWAVEALARLTFLAVIFFYYVNSFFTKVGEGIGGFFQIQSGAYFQIVPWAMEAAEYDVTKVSFIWDIVVFLGTYTEIILPVLIVIGLFTRAAALGMIGFIAVQTFVDLKFHGLEPKTIGALFDIYPESLISDQRTLWIFLLLVLLFKGAGYLSLDHLLRRNRQT